VGNPFEAIVDLMKGHRDWSGAATGVLIIELVVLFGLVGTGFWYFRSRQKSVGRVDRSLEHAVLDEIVEHVGEHRPVDAQMRGQ